MLTPKADSRFEFFSVFMLLYPFYNNYVYFDRHAYTDTVMCSRTKSFVFSFVKYNTANNVAILRESEGTYV